MSGRLPGMENTPKILQMLESNLRNIVPELEKRNIVALIEPINKYTIPGYLLSDFDAGINIIINLIVVFPNYSLFL
jgi:hydroxypyruvate isomerase